MAHIPCSTHCHMLERWKKLNKHYSTSSSRYSQGKRCLIFNKRKLKVFQYLETFSGSQFCYFAIRGRQFTSVCDVTFLRGIYRGGTRQLPPRHHSPPPRRVAAGTGAGAWAEMGPLTSATLLLPSPGAMIPSEVMRLTCCQSASQRRQRASRQWIDNRHIWYYWTKAN